MSFSRDQKHGVALAAAAFFLWGIFPVYLKAVSVLPPLELVAHRIIWSWITLVVLILALRRLPALLTQLRQARMMAALTASTLLLAGNWYLFVFAVNSNRVLEASLAYYINPLLNMALGGLFLHERLRPLQWLAVLLAATGVAVEVVIFGSVPWLALGMGSSFALYGLIRKIAPIDSLNGMMIETSLMLLPAAAYVAAFGQATFNQLSAQHWLLLSGFGLVSSVPLMMFAAAARRIQYTTLGFLQYIGPTLMFALAVLVYNEPLSQAKMVTFGFIWAGVCCFALASLWQKR